MENFDFSKILTKGLKALSKIFTVNHIDIEGNITDTKKHSLYELLLILQTIPSEKFEINLKEIN